MKIPITKPFFNQREKDLIIKPLETGWVVQGPYVSEFEKKFGDFVGARHAVAVSNCTTALHLSLVALGIHSGDKVVIPSFTYVATANAVEYTGATPVFCDIDLRTFNIDCKKLESILEQDKSKAIKAVIPVNLFGLCADLAQVNKLAQRFRFAVIEDSACGFGGYIGETHSGVFGKIGCFSFHPRKAITTGEGGMLVTNDQKLGALFSSLRDHGSSKSDLQRHAEKGGSLLPEFNIVGYNYRMTDFQGALGVSQMEKAETILKARRTLAAQYDEVIKEIPKLLPPLIPSGYISGYQSYVCLYTEGTDVKNLTMAEIDRLNKNRNKLMMALEEKGIATRQGTHAVHTLGFYRKKYGLEDQDFLFSYAADRLTIALPLYFGMTLEEFNYVTSSVANLIG